MHWLALILLILSVRHAEAASFDCTKATSISEKTVCSDPELSRLDDALTATYRSALNRVSDQKSLLNEQKHWLQIRDSCDTHRCTREVYERRIMALANIANITKKGVGQYHCTERGVDFEIKDGVITQFYSSTAVEGEEYANGYTLTCAQHIGLFSQVKDDSIYVLQITGENKITGTPQIGESTNCRVLIEDLGTHFHVHSSRCELECMKFDFKIEKNVCY